MLISIIGAMDSEIASLISKMDNTKETNVKGYTFYTGKYKDNDLVVSKSGIGKVNMTIIVTLIIDHFNPDLIINTGIAGSIDTKIGSVCIADKVIYHDVAGIDLDRNGLGPIYPKKEVLDKALSILGDGVLVGTFATGDQFISSIDEIRIKDKTGIVSIDMESMAVAYTANKFNKDFLIVRSISDNLSLDVARENETFSAEKSINTTLKLIENL